MRASPISVVGFAYLAAGEIIGDSDDRLLRLS